MSKSRKPISKPEFVKILGNATKYPLSMRIARDLWKSGVTLKQFEDTYAISGNSFCKSITEHMTRFHYEHGGPDVDFVPSAMAVQKLEKVVRPRKGRPTNESAVEFAKKLLADRRDHGWIDEDLMKALRFLTGESTRAPAMRIRVQLDPELEAPSTTKKPTVPKGFYVNIRGDWKCVPTRVEADRLMEQNSDPDYGPPIAPVGYCSYCKFKLGSLVMTVRDERRTEHMHHCCYWLNEAKQADIPIGMKMLDSATGHFYVFKGVDKGGWHDETKEQQKVNSANGGGGVSAPDKS